MSVQGIDIKLERRTGVYYAGEVVRGVLTLRTSGNVQCRGFHLSLRGQARVQWHRGDNDYDGTTDFVNQRRTLVGNFFKTGLLDNAGEDAIFGKTAADGTMYIPIDRQEEHQLELILRVIFGKWDDLLGEILLDVPRLVGQRQQQSFPLTRFGKPAMGQVTLSAKILPTEAMFPEGSGQQAHTLLLVLTVHEATGLPKVNDVYCQAYRIPANGERRRRNQLAFPEKNTRLPPGVSTFGFAFPLPTTAPGTAELSVSDYAFVDYAFVRYYLYANVDLAMWRDPSRKIALTVLPNRPVPRLDLLSPGNCQVQDEMIHGCACCGCRCRAADGLVSTYLHTERRSYAPGEMVNLGNSRVVNDSSKVMQVKVILTQHVTMRTGIGSSNHPKKMFVLFQSSIQGHSTVKLDSLCPKLKIPAVFPSFNGGLHDEPITWQRYPCLKWAYTLDLEIGFDKACSTSAIASVPLLIACAPPYPKVLEQASSLAPVSYPPYSAHKLCWDLLDQAITGPERSETTPHITGQEDGGHVTPALECESGVNTYVIHEDNGAVGCNPSYVPAVNYFDSASPLTVPQQETILGAENNSIDQSGSIGGSSSNVDSLLSAMEDSYDKRLAVGQWIRDNPSHAACLSPADVGRVLSAVSFSLDQPAVAAELAAGFEKTGKLTCAHVVAAMQASGYQKLDVAKSMAPIVCDPENKSLVLDQIEFDFEKSFVDACFH